MSLVNRASRLSSKKTLTSLRWAMKLMEDTKNRVKSNAAGIGAGSRKPISKVVQGSPSESGSDPLLANNFRAGLLGRVAEIFDIDAPDPCCLSSRTPSIGLCDIKQERGLRRSFLPPDVTKGSSVTENKL
jgi:hypothetical protein